MYEDIALSYTYKTPEGGNRSMYDKFGVNGHELPDTYKSPLGPSPKHKLCSTSCQECHPPDTDSIHKESLSHTDGCEGSVYWGLWDYLQNYDGCVPLDSITVSDIALPQCLRCSERDCPVGSIYHYDESGRCLSCEGAIEQALEDEQPEEWIPASKAGVSIDLPPDIDPIYEAFMADRD